MQKNGWFPRSIRNRLAMLMGLLSLGLFITWNLLPIKNFPEAEAQTMATMFWPNIYESLLKIDASNLDFEEITSAMATVLVTLLGLISLSLLPAWKLWQASALLRVIPAILMLMGFGIVMYFTLKGLDMERSHIAILFTISLNFLTAAVSLLLFKNEFIEHADQGISST
jgi:hypothetical protein